MSKHAAVVPSLLTAPRVEGEARRATGVKPDCPKCGHNRHVVRFWHGSLKMWVCSVHFKIGSTKIEEQSLKDRLLRKPIKNVEHDLTSVLPNRATRRRRGR